MTFDWIKAKQPNLTRSLEKIDCTYCVTTGKNITFSYRHWTTLKLNFIIKLSTIYIYYIFSFLLP